LLLLGSLPVSVLMGMAGISPSAGLEI